MSRAKKMVLMVMAKETERNDSASSSNQNIDTNNISTVTVQSEDSSCGTLTSPVYPFAQNQNDSSNLFDTSVTLGSILASDNNANTTSLPIGDDTGDEQSVLYINIQPEGECCNKIATTGVAEDREEILTLNSTNASQCLVIEEGEYIVTSENPSVHNLETILDIQPIIPVTNDTVNEDLRFLQGGLGHEIELANDLEIDTDGQQVQQNHNICRKRKRKADPDSWERNIRKRQRMSGKTYTSRTGKVIEEKVFQPVDNCSCRFQCTKQIPPERQKALFDEYWGLGDSGRQKCFISSLVSEENVKRHRKRKIDSGRVKNKSRFYSLPCVSGEKSRVCLKFFCSVFQISFQIIDLALKHCSSSGIYVGTDGRIGRPAPNATSEDRVRHVKKHIDSFPRMESHYCRKYSKKLYLSPELNVAELYRLYCNEYCQRETIIPVSESVYRAIFRSYEPPLSTYVPKKDRCTKCKRYYEATDKTELEEEFQNHFRRKSEAMKMKEEDMKKGVLETSQITITFDLQAVLSIPFAGDSQIYYRRKLNVYNFTIYDSDKNGYCYLWDETNGMKGASEIGSAILSYLKQLPDTVTHVTTYSDTAGGQNRNQYIAAAMLYAINNLENIETIDVKYMESGHSYLEADSMHATIERARRHRQVYTPREWCLLIEMARKKPRPYIVKMLTFNDIHDLQTLASKVMVNTKITADGSPVRWLKIKWLRFVKEEPSIIYFKYELSDPNFMTLDTSRATKKSKPFCWNAIELTPKYRERMPVSVAKKKDLLHLLRTGVIPADYAAFIEGIPCKKGVRDLVPYQEGSDDED